MGLTQGWSLQGLTRLLSEASHMSSLHHRHHPLPGSPSPFCSGCTLDSWSFSGNRCTSQPEPPLSAPRVWGHGLPGTAAAAPTWPPASRAQAASSATGDLGCPRGLALG